MKFKILSKEDNKVHSGKGFFVCFDGTVKVGNFSYTRLVFGPNLKSVDNRFTPLFSTGISDIKGVEMYQSDLIKVTWNDGLLDRETVGEIVFNNGRFEIDDGKRDNFWFLPHMTFEKVGQKYEDYKYPDNS